MTEVAGKAAVVTGGGSGIGRGLAVTLAAEKAKVVVADIIKDKAEAVAEEIQKSGGVAIAVGCDVSDRGSVHDLKARANAMFGRVSLLFANAGATSFDQMNGISNNELDWIIQVNLMGVACCVQAFLPDMVASEDGHIVATSSVAGLIPHLLADHAPYSGAKAGVIGLVLNMRRELADTGVHATVLCPADVITGMKDSPKYRPTRFGGPSDKLIPTPTEYKPRHPRSPEEAARMVLLAVRRNRPMVITGAEYREDFLDTYLSVVQQAFDDAAEFDKAAGSHG